MTRSVLSLFSGVGGFDLGLERSGWKIVAQAESDDKARGVLRRHWPDVQMFDDVRDVGAETVDRPELICGGFPCQDISHAGKRAGLAGERSGLWWEFHRIIGELEPRWVLIENVAGLLNSNRGADMAAILRALSDLGYVGEWRVVNSRYFGVPQRRRRVFLVGHLGERRGPAVLLEQEGRARHLEAVREEETEAATRAEGGAGRGGAGGPGTLVAEQGLVTALTTGLGSGGPDLAHPQPQTFAWQMGGTNRTWIHDQPGTARSLVSSQTLAVALPYAFNGFNGLSAQVSTEVFPTMRVGNSSGTPQVMVPYVGVRRLTPRECERLQGFPDDWTMLDTTDATIADTHRYRFMGNAVTVNVIEWIGRRMRIAAARDRVLGRVA